MDCRKEIRRVPPLIVGAVLLMVTSFISLYWTLIGIESALKFGFDWMLLGIFGIASFAFGFMGSIMAMRRKHFAFTMLSVCFPLIENTALVKHLFDNYKLPIPWTAINLSLLTSTISGIIIGRSDEEFP